MSVLRREGGETMSEHITDWRYDIGNGTYSIVVHEEIVRCRDCKHSYMFDMSWKSPKTNDIRYCGHGTYCQYEVPDDGFCAWGERND